MKPKLSEDQFQNSKEFIYKHARLLERLLFAYFFENGGQQACLKALAAYQNEDGGFGNGLEPDILCPESSAIGAETAMGILDWLDAPETEISHRLIEWIVSHQNPSGDIDHPPETMINYPHQPWWKNPDKERILSLAGLMKKWGIDQPDFYAKARICYDSLTFPDPIEYYHYPYILYLKYCGESEEDKARFSSIVAQMPSFLEKYSDHLPLFSRYWSFVSELLGQETLNREAENFINALQDDGGIVTPYPDLPWWNPISLLNGLIELKTLPDG